MSDGLGRIPGIRAARPSDRAAIDTMMERARAGAWANRLADRDATLWSDDPAVQAKIANRLGWLDAPAAFTAEIPALEGYGEDPLGLGDGERLEVIVAGMGGSSLAPEVLARAFAGLEGWHRVRVCDTTDPAAVASVFEGLDLRRALFIVASKSGTTTETLAFAAYARERVAAALGEEAVDEHFVAISDPSPCVDGITAIVDAARLFLNPADIGGRYSALSYVGLVPASLLGIDLDSLLASASVAIAASREPEPTANFALALGCALAALAKEGRDKATLVVDAPIDGLGAWVEQLVAESTGKEGLGIVPIDGEALGSVASYGDDRLFVRIRLDGGIAPKAADGTDVDARLDELARAGHPVLEWRLADPIDLGAEFVRWEVATAIAGAALRINPFDEPNVTESKMNTAAVLTELAASGSLPVLPEKTRDGSLSLWVDDVLPAAFADDAVKLIGGQLGRLDARGYIGIQAYVEATPARSEMLGRIRTLLRDATRRATTVGYGPRFLHSTGQLHKGGAPIGWFLQIVAEHPTDAGVPGRDFSFGQLIDAQALGDARSLVDHGLPVLRVRLGADADAGLAALAELIGRAVAVR
ncbi:MAG: hypothetical protein RLZZ432_238 [Chloroflexota bacterium]